MIARYEGALRRTARRYSLDAEDAEDAYQRALEIALTKAPTTDLRELIRWTQTVTKHEALAVRQSREKLLGYQRPREGTLEDPVALIPARGDSPEERAERHEDIGRSREALQALKPAERRALGLLAEGYSYAEIGERTGYSQTKINRLLAEGRARFRAIVASSEDGGRCRDLQPLLSAFCDGETGTREAIEVREHLRACASCRATMRTYRAAPRVVAALLPLLPPSRSLLERAQDLANNLGARLPGLGGGDAVATQVAAAGGARGAGMAAIAKLLTVCAGAAGGAAACVATGVLPAPVLNPDPAPKPAVERQAASASETTTDEAVDYQPAPAPVVAAPPGKEPAAEPKGEEPEPVRPATGAASSGAVEYEAPAPEAAPVVANGGESGTASSSAGSAAGEFGP
ncbi:MAG TPA: sigma-70 family RNA polymerase sigma factor [Solirubrobacterales bacterium]|nr:sigma-70 family RNA polymerase sigma factor [Solirubrobacterales bacterium]